MAVVSDKSQSAFQFLLLPAEIRNAIYTLVLTPPHLPYLRRIATRGLCSDYLLPSLNLSPALLRTCHQIYHEASSILYGTNTFASHPSLLTSLPYLVSPRRPITHGSGRFRIRKWYIYMRLDVVPTFDAVQLEQAFSEAEELEIDVFQPTHRSCDLSVLMLFEKVRGVGRARVTGGAAVDSGYAEWLERTLMTPIGLETDSYAKNRDNES